RWREAEFIHPPKITFFPKNEGRTIGKKTMQQRSQYLILKSSFACSDRKNTRPARNRSMVAVTSGLAFIDRHSAFAAVVRWQPESTNTLPAWNCGHNASTCVAGPSSVAQSTIAKSMSDA